MREGLPAYILTERDGSCSNGGVSARVAKIVITTIDGQLVPGFARVRPPCFDAPEVGLNYERGHYVARPTDVPTGKHLMSSGPFVHSSDERYRELIGHGLPIPLHDRTE